MCKKKCSKKVLTDEVYFKRQSVELFLKDCNKLQAGDVYKLYSNIYKDKNYTILIGTSVRTQAIYSSIETVNGSFDIRGFTTRTMIFNELGPNGVGTLYFNGESYTKDVYVKNCVLGAQTSTPNIDIIIGSTLGYSNSSGIMTLNSLGGYGSYIFDITILNCKKC